MKIRPTRFNIYLLLLLCCGLAVACKTTEERQHSKEASTLRVFLARATEHGNVAVFRQSPVHFEVDHEPLVTEADVVSAEVIDQPGGFAIKTQFNGHAALVLEGATVAHKSEHLAIQSSFGENRWLAAPLIKRRITNGELVFTPDATREEADRIVRGLTNVVNKIKKESYID